MIRLEFNASAIFDRLDKVRGVLDDMTPVYTEIAEYMVKATKGRFLTSLAPDGTAWKAKSPATIAAYLARKDGNRPKPLIGPTGRLGKEIARLVTRDGAEIGSVLEYSAVMQHGAAKGAFGTTSTGRPIPWGAIPARPWLGISADDERAIIEIADEHLAEAAGD